MLRLQLVIWVLIAAFVATPAWAVTKNWIAGSDNWTNAAAWDPAGVPGAGDDMNIVFSDDVARTVAYANNGPPVTLGALKLDMTGPGTNLVELLLVQDRLATTSEQIGVDGRARANQTGGTHATNSLVLGANVGANGTYDLSTTGALVLSGNSSIGLSGTGNFNQSGGTVNVTGPTTLLYLGRNHGAVGNYNMTGGFLTAPVEVVGSGGEGNFFHSAGSNNASNVSISEGVDAGGAYLLSGTGQLTTDTLNVGVGGSASFTQSGGSSNSNTVNIATAAGSDGYFMLTGGAASAGSIYVGGTVSGPGGIGIMSVTGLNTTLTVSGAINIYQSVNNAFHLAGGTLNTPAINVNGLPLRFNWTGGTLNITNDVSWGGGSATSTSAIFGSSLTLSQSKILRVTGNETIGGDGSFALNVSSGGTHSVTGNITLKPGGSVSASSTSVLNYASFTQAGGTIIGTFRNLTNFVYQSGSFNGTFINDGTASIGATLNVTTLMNNGSMTIASGQTFTATSQITNSGNLIVSGGTIGNVSVLTNAIGATLTAHGTINPMITNQGTMIVDGLLTVGAVTNTGVVQGAGTITSFNNSFGNNAGGVVNANVPGGALAFPFSFANNAGATVNIGPTSTFAPSQNWTNSGVVNLQGAGSRLSGGTMINNGIVQGFGTIVPTLGTSNSGVFRASGGDLVFANAFTNSTQSTVQVLAGSSATFLQGMLGNSGLVSIVGGTFDNTGKILSNQGTINGYGTLRTGGLTNNVSRLISVGEGNLDVFGNVTNNGVISIQSGRNAYFWNNVSGSGSFTGTGTAVFLATLSPGTIPASVNFAGGVDLGGGTSLAMELGGTTAGTQYDQIHVAGQLSLGGILSLSLINGFAPSAGNTFDLLDWGTLAGTFSSIALPSLGSSLVWDTSQLYTSGAVSVVSALPGDYNGNGVVDAADYVLWRKGGPLANEVDTPGTVNAADNDAWRERFGNSAGGSGAAVPEPSAMLLVLAAVVCSGFRARNRSS